MTPQQRRAAWNKSIREKQFAGMKVEGDPEFLTWVEEWISGAIDIGVLQHRYRDLLASRYPTPAQTASIFRTPAVDQSPPDDTASQSGPLQKFSVVSNT